MQGCSVVSLGHSFAHDRCPLWFVWCLLVSQRLLKATLCLLSAVIFCFNSKHCHLDRDCWVESWRCEALWTVIVVCLFALHTPSIALTSADWRCCTISHVLKVGEFSPLLFLTGALLGLFTPAVPVSRRSFTHLSILKAPSHYQGQPGPPTLLVFLMTYGL